MKISLTVILSALSFMVLSQTRPLVPEPGVSYALAAYRRGEISDIRYNLDFTIPAEKSRSIQASEDISFKLKTNQQSLQLDFKQDAAHVKTFSVNGKRLPAQIRQEHLIVDRRYLHPGQNRISISFIAGETSLNRNDDYLYALFVPDHARTVFPCFDQPDLKARFKLTLRVPSGWKVLTNAEKADSAVAGPQTIFRFAESDLLSTYLFSFTAGKYRELAANIAGYKASFLYRETDQAKIRASADSIITLHQNAISFLQDYTGIKYPFQKIGFAAIPDFQFGGMEHPGAVQYKASTFFLDSTATSDQYISRTNLIAHETAHMWFGDLVTMRWFNDVWMKEVFANFMADKVAESLIGSEAFNFKFLHSHYPAAYATDRSAGANPIRQKLDNLQDAGSLYGNIIYHKAPVMMRQLELLMGKEPFRLGLQEYLKKYAYNNAAWPELISILSKYTKADLYNWNTVWVNQPGRPVFDYKVSYDDSTISRFTITQRPEFGEHRIWPQVFSVSFVYPDHIQEIKVNMNTGSVDLRSVAGLKKPSFILFNADAMGYGLFPADKDMLPQLFLMQDPLQRASAYISVYENMLSGRTVKPDELLERISGGLTKEKNEMNLRLLSAYITTIYWTFISPARRQNLAEKLERALWDAMPAQQSANNKKILFKTYQDICLSSQAKEKLYGIWQAQQAPGGVKLSEDDYTSLALTIALKTDTAFNVLAKQRDRIRDADRKKRLEFLMPALSPDPAIRDAFFSSLKDRKNRAKEAWVTSALNYLNSPLRQSSSIKYLRISLDMLEEIQQTGDIFFPQSWLASIISNYRSKEAAKIVTDFLKEHPAYNPKLRDKILQSADGLFRAQQLPD